MASPLRRHAAMESKEEQKIDEAEVPCLCAISLSPFAQVIDGLVIGRVIDLRAVDGAIRGPVMNEADTEPSNADINSGFTFAQFRKGIRSCFSVAVRTFPFVGDRVLGFWWGRWWRAKVHALAARDRTVSIRFDWSNRVVSKYLPRCVHNLERRS